MLPWEPVVDHNTFADQPKKRPATCDGAGLFDLPVSAWTLFWWSWGESNPRPKAFVRQIYTLSWLIWF